MLGDHSNASGRCLHGQSESLRQRTGLDEVQGERGHSHYTESPFHKQRPGLPAATRLRLQHSTICAKSPHMPIDCMIRSAEGRSKHRKSLHS